MPYQIDYKTLKKVVSKALTKEYRITWEDIVKWIKTLGTEWNLMNKEMIEEVIKKERA